MNEIKELREQVIGLLIGGDEFTRPEMMKMLGLWDKDRLIRNNNYDLLEKVLRTAKIVRGRGKCQSLTFGNEVFCTRPINTYRLRDDLCKGKNISA